MPPAKTIIVDTAKMLRSIAEQAAQQHERTRLSVIASADANWSAGVRWGMPAEQREQRRDANIAEQLADKLPHTAWVPRNLEALAGKALTVSERIRHQQALRQLEADGLVVLDTRFVRLTDAGRAAVDG